MDNPRHVDHFMHGRKQYDTALDQEISPTFNFPQRFKVWIQVQRGISLQSNNSKYFKFTLLTMVAQNYISEKNIYKLVITFIMLTFKDSRFRPLVTNVNPCVSMATPVLCTCSSMYLFTKLNIFLAAFYKDINQYRPFLLYTMYLQWSQIWSVQTPWYYLLKKVYLWPFKRLNKGQTLNNRYCTHNYIIIANCWLSKVNVKWRNEL